VCERERERRKEGGRDRNIEIYLSMHPLAMVSLKASIISELIDIPN
jgi:hypothetical protein